MSASQEFSQELGPNARFSDQQFVMAWMQHQSSPRVAEALGIAEQAVRRRRRSIEERYNIALDTRDAVPNRVSIGGYQPTVAAPRLELDLKDGQAIVFSDAHYWPNEITVAHEALLELSWDLKPDAIIANGDVFDGASISAHPKGGWESLPSVTEELEAVKARMGEIEREARGARLLRTRGNHDARFERFLATKVPEFRGASGFSLNDHLPAWTESWSVFVNGNTVIKHRWHNGIHAAYNNTLKAGLSVVTGHLHSLKVMPWTDYTGTRYGVDTGTLANPDGPQFEYCEDGPKNWRSGFVVLSWRDGKLLPPELCQVVGKAAYFRGEKVG